MYEKVTYEDILQRMLDRVPNTIDKREGAIVFDALAPAAVEFQNMLIELDTILKETFCDTASREYLIKRAAERGIAPHPASYAVLKAESTPETVEITIGSRFSLNELNYIITEKLSDGVYMVQCETVGAIGNSYFGNMIPIDYIQGLESISITELFIPGEDEEDTEVFRNRCFETFESQAFGGNVQEYKDKIKALDGVGGVKIYPVWNGGGTVKVIFTSAIDEKPSQTLIDLVQTTVDPIQNQGKGVGIAPIGHVVTVVGCGESTINIQTHITFQPGWDWDAAEPYIQAAVDGYFKDLSATWDSNDNLIVRISQIETRLLDVAGVLDIADTTLNGDAQNFIVAADNIPVRGNISNV